MEVEEVCKSLSTITNTIEDILKNAKYHLKQGPVHNFVDTQIGCLYKLVPTYTAELRRLGIGGFSEIEEFCRANFRNAELQDCVTELDQAEREWEEFLLNIDKELVEGNSSQVTPVQVGDPFTLDCTLVDLDTEEQVPTQSEEFGSAKLLVVSFGAIEGVRRWRDDTSCTLRILVDEQRRLYNYFGLDRSVFKTWTIEMLRYYAERDVGGKPPIKPYENIKDDVHQMGGDFVLDKDGRFLLVHRSRISIHRPTVSSLLSIMCPANTDIQ